MHYIQGWFYSWFVNCLLFGSSCSFATGPSMFCRRNPSVQLALEAWIVNVSVPFEILADHHSKVLTFTHDIPCCSLRVDLLFIRQGNKKQTFFSICPVTWTAKAMGTVLLFLWCHQFITTMFKHLWENTDKIICILLMSFCSIPEWHTLYQSSIYYTVFREMYYNNFFLVGKWY